MSFLEMFHILNNVLNTSKSPPYGVFLPLYSSLYCDILCQSECVRRALGQHCSLLSAQPTHAE